MNRLTLMLVLGLAGCGESTPSTFDATVDHLDASDVSADVSADVSSQDASMDSTLGVDASLDGSLDASDSADSQ
jgi:hypothetical protein